MGRTVRRMVPSSCLTVGALIDSATPVSAWCSRCNVGRPVDLAALAEAKGRAYSLLGKRAHCRTCGELVAFHAAQPPGVWRVNLSDGS